MMNYTAIIADDHKTLRAGLKVLLNDLGIKVIGEASNGAEFLDILPKQLPDFVLMDIQMPVMNGIEASRIALSKYPELKIIVLTMYDDEENYQTMVDIGVKGFLLKESEHNEMEIAIKSVMSGKTYFSQELLVNLLRKKDETVKIMLKPREQAILELLCKGHSSQEIANMLFVSNRTVEKTRSELMLKTGTNNSISLAIFAVKNGLVSI